MGNDVAAAIDARHAPQRAKLREHPLGAALFKECRGWNAAQLQMLFVDPLLLPDKPLQGVAQRGRIGQISRHFHQRRSGRKRNGFDRSCQMPV